MKRLLLLALVGLFFCLVGRVEAAETWEIGLFDVEIRLPTAGPMEVEERLEVDFGGVKKHGIFREIPETFRDEFNSVVQTKIRVTEISDEHGDVPYALTRSNGYLKIRIGDANVFVEGKKTYTIKYEVDQAILFFDDHEELYWNVTGNNWPVVIEQARVLVAGPVAANQFACFTGFLGSTQSRCGVEREDELVISKSLTQLNPGEGFTVVVGYPNGTFVPPTLWERMRDFLLLNWGYAIPVVALAILMWLYMSQGRDRYYIQSVTGGEEEQRVPLLAMRTVGDRYYPPEGLTAAEAGLIIDESAGNSELSAILLGLAEKKHLSIKQVSKKDWEFEKHVSDTTLTSYESLFLEGMFGNKTSVRLSELKNTFYTTAHKVTNELYKSVVRDGYFPFRPDAVRGVYLVIGMVMVVLGFGLVSSLSRSSWGVAPGLGIIISGLLVIGFSWSMPRKTAKGRAALVEVLGFKRVITLGAYRQELFEKHGYFSEILPYAAAFGLVSQWSKTIAKHNIKPPDWYQVYQGTSFERSMRSLVSTSTTTLVSSPKSSASSGRSGFSGGSSGGGFGGGGGGSW